MLFVEPDSQQNVIDVSILVRFEYELVFEEKPFVTHSRKDVFGGVDEEDGKSDKKGHKKDSKDGNNGNQGATIKERCPKCGNPEMTFHTMQLRSADEGQTVFYTCPKCAYMIIEFVSSMLNPFCILCRYKYSVNT